MIPQGDKTREQGRHYAYDMTVKPVVDVGRFATGQMAPEELPGFGLTAAGLFLPMAKGVLRPAAATLEVAAPQILRAPAYGPQFNLPRYVPPGGVPERVKDVVASKSVRDDMLKIIGEGADMGGANWWNSERTKEWFLSELGKRAGEERFGLFADMIAATSPRSPVGESIRNASYYLTEYASGRGLPKIGTKPPNPYGHPLQELHQSLIHRVVNKGFDPLRQPKIASMAQNTRGNLQPVTVDMHAARLPGMAAQDERFLRPKFREMVKRGELSMEDAVQEPSYWIVGPGKNELPALEKFYQSLANEAGLLPGQGQSAAWVGGGGLTGLRSRGFGNMDEFVADRVRRTAEHRGIDPEEVIRRFVRAQKPLIGVGGAGAVAVGSSADQPE
jgi:hypothetical protein